MRAFSVVAQVSIGDGCDTTLPHGMEPYEIAKSLEMQPKPAKDADQGRLHDGADMGDLVLAANLDDPANEPEGDVRYHLAFGRHRRRAAGDVGVGITLFTAAAAEFLGHRKTRYLRRRVRREAVWQVAILRSQDALDRQRPMLHLYR